MDELLAALGYAGDTLDKSLGGRAVRGVLGGRYDEALSALPFSDTLGLTDPTRRVSGEDLVTGYGLASPGSWGATLGGIGAEMLLDPATLATGGLAAFKGLRAAGKGLNAFGDAGTLARRLAEITPPPALDRRLAELGSTVDPLDRLRVGLQPMARPEPGALAHFLGDESGALRPFQEIGKRTDPDFVNARPWFHGTATPGLTPQTLDPLKTDPHGLFGRGIYTTADPTLAAEYADVRLPAARNEWPQAALDAVRPLGRTDPAAATRLDADLRGLVAGSNLPDGQYLTELADSLARRPGEFSREAIHHIGQVTRTQPALADVLRSHGLPIGPPPRGTIYEAGTNVGKILDLDQSLIDAPPDLLESLVAGGEHYREHLGFNPVTREIDDAASNAEMWQRAPDVGGVIQGLKEYANDLPGGQEALLIRALREAGYDALAHTGGMRAGGGKNLHDVLIALDPNDTASKVGRSGQITRFDPHDPATLLRALGLGG